MKGTWVNRFRLWFFTFLCVSLTSIADARDLKVGFSYAKPPYVFAQSKLQVGDVRGIELEIMRRALEETGHTFRPRFFAYNNLHSALKAGKVDVIATVRSEEKWPFYSEKFVHFQNFAITRKGQSNAISSIAGLMGRTIAAWQGATKDLGAAYEQVIQSSPLYKEVGDQQQQVLLFLHGRVETLIIDGAIFRYWAKLLGFDTGLFEYHDIFGGKTNFVAGFVSKNLRDDFNKGLLIIKRSGEYDKIFQKYDKL